MNKYILLLAIFCTVLFTSCGSDEGNPDEPTSKETYSASFQEEIDADAISVIMEVASAQELAKFLPCTITESSNEVEFCLGGTQTTTYMLSLSKWESASLVIDTKKVVEYGIFNVKYTTYEFTPGEYSIEDNGHTDLFLVTKTGIDLLNPYNHKVINSLISLENGKKVYDEWPENPIRSFNKEDSNTYSKAFTLTKLADDHFYIENVDYTFECYNTALGLRFTQIKPEEKEIGLLSKK